MYRFFLLGICYFVVTILYSEQRSYINNSELSILHFSILSRDNVLFEQVLSSQQGLINTKDINGCSPLHLAVQVGDLKMVEALVRLGADINSFNQEGETPIFIAVEFYHHDIAKYLIKQGADLTVYNNSGFSLEKMATMYKNNVFLKYLKYL